MGGLRRFRDNFLWIDYFAKKGNNRELFSNWLRSAIHQYFLLVNMFMICYCKLYNIFCILTDLAAI